MAGEFPAQNPVAGRLGAELALAPEPGVEPGPGQDRPGDGQADPIAQVRPHQTPLLRSRTTTSPPHIAPRIASRSPTTVPTWRSR